MLYSIGVNLDKIDKIETSVASFNITNTGSLFEILAKVDITF
jgi:hypothetical protein